MEMKKYSPPPPPDIPDDFFFGNGGRGTARYPDAKGGRDTVEEGAQFMDFVLGKLAARGIALSPYASKKNQFGEGETIQGWEIKSDFVSETSGRLSIEIAEKSKASNANYVPSGIYRADNTWMYVQGNFRFFYVFFKKHLVALHKTGRYKEHETPTFRGFYLPMCEADIWGFRFDGVTK